MKICEEYAALLDAFIDGELDSETESRVRDHLAACPACAAYAADALAIRASFPGLEDTEAPEGLADSVMAAIRADAAPRKKKNRWFMPLVSLAACAAMVFAVWRVLPQGGGASGAAAPSSPAAAAAAESRGSEPYSLYEADAAEDAASEGTESGAPGQEAASAPQTNTSLTMSGGDGRLAVPPSAGVSESGGGLESNSAEQKAAGEDRGDETVGGLSMAPDAAPQSAAGGTADAWIEGGNVVFSRTLCLAPDDVGDALAGFEGRPYSSADRPGQGVLGTGYAMEPADFERILGELGDLSAPAPNQDRTTELCCIVVTAAADPAN